MDVQRIQHAFLNKPFYKRFHKCTECRRRIIWTRIAKCMGCKTYCHQRCIKSDNDECCRPNPVKSTVQITVPAQETVVTRSNEADRNSQIVVLPENDIGDLDPAESEEVPDSSENSANGSCVEIPKAAERRLYVPDGGNLGVDAGQQGEHFEAIKDATPSDDVMSVDDCNTVPAIEELHVADPMLASCDDYGMIADELSTAISNEEVQVDAPMPNNSDDVMTAEQCSTVYSNEEIQADERVSTPHGDVIMTDECSTVHLNEEVQDGKPMSTPHGDVMMTDESSTVHLNEEVQDGEPMSTPSGDGMPAGECSAALSNEKVHTKSTRDVSAFKLVLCPLPCTETEVKESQNDENGVEQNKCNSGDGVQDVTVENKMDEPL